MEYKEYKHAGMVWILSGIISLILYIVLSLMDQSVPGMEQLVVFLTSLDGVYILGAAFLSILIEGIYVIGNFFPGASLVVLLAILSQLGGTHMFLLTILAIFVGWCLAGVINIFLAKVYHTKILKRVHNPEYQVLHRPFSTWFPSFRANYEVAQIVEGGEAWSVLYSSVKVKFLVSLVMFFIMLLLPLFLDINNISNEEGLVALLIIAAVSITVGILKIKKANKNRVEDREAG